ncbi:basic proline-rich protein-like [Prinia subflava]|uniref:basic proline-rich protein-like n=1 Tax=Prinia subflava TaxID=208062 RepID=UPI002FE17F07
MTCTLHLVKTCDEDFASLLKEPSPAPDTSPAPPRPGAPVRRGLARSRPAVPVSVPVTPPGPAAASPRGPEGAPSARPSPCGARGPRAGERGPGRGAERGGGAQRPRGRLGGDARALPRPPSFSPRLLAPRPWPLAPGAGLLAGAGRESLLTPARGVTAVPFASPPAPPAPPPKRGAAPEGAQENPLPGRGQGRCCRRLPATAAGVRRSRYFPSRLGSAAPRSPSPRCLRQVPRPSCPTENTHGPGTRPGYPAHSNKQTETCPVAKPTDGGKN